MYQKILTPAVNAPITPTQLAAFGRFDVPENPSDDYTLLQTFVAAAVDQVETMAQTALQYEQILLTLDFFPNTQDPRNLMQYEISYAYAAETTPWWWYGFPAHDSIELVRRPVQVPALSGATANVTAVSLANNVLTVTTTLNPTVGNVVLLTNTQEGNVFQPQLTPSTTPFLNGVPLTVLTANATEFTATFNNFYTLGSGINQIIPGSYTNNSDTGTAQVWSNPCLVQYYDQNGVLNTWNTNNYFVLDDKICLTVGNWWPLTNRRQDCIQLSYWAGNQTTPAQNGLPANTIAPRLQMAVMYLANHMWQVRDIITVEPTSEVGKTLCLMLSSYRTGRIPR